MLNKIINEIIVNDMFKHNHMNVYNKYVYHQ